MWSSRPTLELPWEVGKKGRTEHLRNPRGGWKITVFEAACLRRLGAMGSSSRVSSHRGGGGAGWLNEYMAWHGIDCTALH